MYRLLGRDRLQDGEVRPYVQSVAAAVSNGAAAGEGAPACQRIELESLDLVQLGPYLLALATDEKTQAALTQAQAAVKEIRTEALRQGAVQGREETKQELLPALVAFADAAQALIVFEEQLIARSTPYIVELALEIAEKILGRAVEQQPEIVASVLERAKQEVVDARQLRIWLNPVDFELLSETRPDLVKMGDEAGRKIDVAMSEEISRGGCRLETEIGLVDATIPTQLDEIRRQLLGEDLPDADAPARI